MAVDTTQDILRQVYDSVNEKLKVIDSDSSDGVDELKALIGEVQASPTENTVLDRLKDLLTGIVLATGSNAIGKLAANSGVDIGDVDVEDRIGRLLGKITNYDVLANGTLAALNETVELAGAGLGTIGIGISGTWVGTIVAEINVGDGVWDTIPLIDQTLGSAALSTTVNGSFLVGVAGALTVRIRASAWTSGTATVYLEGTSASSGVFLSRSIPTGLNSIGKLAANSGVDIGDVDVTSLPVGTAAMAASTPVTIATDDTIISALSAKLPAALGQLASAASMSTVLSTEQEAILTALQTALEIIDDWDETDRAKVNPIAGQAGIAANAGVMDALTTRVTLATDDTHMGAVGTAADVDGVLHGQQRYIGEALDTIETTANAIQTATEIIDDWDATHDGAVSADGAQVMAEAKDFDGAALPNAVAEGDAVRPAASLNGVSYMMPVSEDGSQSPYDSLNNAITVQEFAPVLLTQTKTTGITQLTAPGDTAEILVNNLGVYGYTFTVATIDTNVVVQLEGSIDQTNYATLPIDNTAVTSVTIANNQMTVTANGTYIIYSSAPVVDVRFDFVSEAGGVNATIDVDFFGRRK